MMILPSPGVLDSLIRDRQTELRMTPMRRSASAGAAWRVRIGHALIVAGTTLGGERADQPACPPAIPHPA